MFTRTRPSHASPDSCESREVWGEPQRLEHQRWRLAEILDRERVSREMADYLRHRLGEIDRRLCEIGGAAPPYGGSVTPQRAERDAADDGEEPEGRSGAVRNPKGWFHHATPAPN